MGAKGGGGEGYASPESRNQRGTSPQKQVSFSNFFDVFKSCALSNIFKIKWPKSEEKLNFGGRWVQVPMHPSPQCHEAIQTFMAEPSSIVTFCDSFLLLICILIG